LGPFIEGRWIQWLPAVHTCRHRGHADTSNILTAARASGTQMRTAEKPSKLCTLSFPACKDLLTLHTCWLLCALMQLALPLTQTQFQPFTASAGLTACSMRQPSFLCLAPPLWYLACVPPRVSGDTLLVDRLHMWMTRHTMHIVLASSCCSRVTPPVLGPRAGAAVSPCRKPLQYYLSFQFIISAKFRVLRLAEPHGFYTTRGWSPSILDDQRMR
jgi:hypothetical protein